MALDAATWRRVDALLDELLDLDPGARPARLQALRVGDAGLADELASLLDGAERAERDQFLSAALSLPAVFERADAGLVGERIGAYVIESPLGQGGTGAVWKARRVDGRFDGAVAFKLLHLSLVGRTGARRFEQEGAILASLTHPNIARLLDAGVTAAGQPYLVLELVEGDRIDRHCDIHRLDVEARIALFGCVLDAVAHAHRHLVIHRDIKPGNILVGRESGVKLLDFGIAKLVQDSGADASDLTRDGGRALTPDYAAPEQLRGEPVTTATDVYSLGVLLYQLLTGRHPTVSPNATPAEVVHATLDGVPGKLGIAVAQVGPMADAIALQRVAADRGTSTTRLARQLGGDLETIVAKALRKAPSERYATVDAFHDDLRRWAAGEPVAARPDSLSYRATRFVSRHRVPVAATALTAVAIVIGLIGTITQAQRATLASERATHEAVQARSERDNALEQQRLLRGTNEFFVMMMRDAAGGDPGAIRKQLDRARTLIGRTSFEQPIVKVALQRQIAARYLEIGDSTAAAQLLRDAIASTQGTELAAPTSGARVNLACSLANALGSTDPNAALHVLDEADRLVAGGAVLSVASQVECRVIRGYAMLALGRYPEGISVIRHALATLDTAGIRGGEQRKVVRSALSLALLDDGRNADAMAIAGPLLAESQAEQGDESIAVLRRSSIVTSITRAGGDPLAALARSDVDRRRAARLLGDEDDVSIGMEHGRILLALERNPEAVDDLKRTRQAAIRHNELSDMLPLGLAEVEALLGAGRIDDASQRFSELTALGDQAARNGRPERIDVLRVGALLALKRGDTKAATTSLDAAERLILDSSDAAMHPKAFSVALLRAAAIVASWSVNASAVPPDQVASALADVDRALAAARRNALQPERSCETGRALLLRAQILAVAGRDGESRRDAAAAEHALSATMGASSSTARAAAALASKPT